MTLRFSIECPQCGGTYPVDHLSCEDNCALCYIPLGWEKVSNEWICKACTSQTLTFVEAFRAMLDGKTVSPTEGSTKFEVRIRDGMTQVRSKPPCPRGSIASEKITGGWGEWEDHYIEGYFQSYRWKVVE